MTRKMCLDTLSQIKWPRQQVTVSILPVKFGMATVVDQLLCNSILSCNSNYLPLSHAKEYMWVKLLCGYGMCEKSLKSVSGVDDVLLHVINT